MYYLLYFSSERSKQQVYSVYTVLGSKNDFRYWVCMFSLTSCHSTPLPLLKKKKMQFGNAKFSSECELFFVFQCGPVTNYKFFHLHKNPVDLCCWIHGTCPHTSQSKPEAQEEPSHCGNLQLSLSLHIYVACGSLKWYLSRCSVPLTMINTSHNDCRFCDPQNIHCEIPVFPR